MADGNVFWLDVVAERLRRWPLWITVTVVALFLLFPFGIAYLEGSLPALMVGGAWRIILACAGCHRLQRGDSAGLQQFRRSDRRQYPAALSAQR